jgi:hypothetical protein
MAQLELLLPIVWRRSRSRETAYCGRCDGLALSYANSAEKAAETTRAAKAHGQPVITIKADSADPEAVVDAGSTDARFGHATFSYK